MSIQEDQAEALEIARQECHVANGESGEIVFKKRAPGTVTLSEILTVGKSWTYTDETRLPEGADFELKVAECQLTEAQALLASAMIHDDRTYYVLSRPTRPAQMKRYWRFFITDAANLTDVPLFTGVVDVRFEEKGSHQDDYVFLQDLSGCRLTEVRSEATGKPEVQLLIPNAGGITQATIDRVEWAVIDGIRYENRTLDKPVENPFIWRMNLEPIGTYE